jgi:hypothetical protein
MEPTTSVTAKCPTPGIYQISEEEYHGDPCPAPSLSASVAVVLLDETPAAAKLAHPRLSGAGYEPEEKDIFDRGSACHELLLEQSEARICVCDYDDWRTKAAREEKAFARANGQYPLLKHQLDGARAMAKRAREFVATSELAGIFDKGKPEQAVIWKEDGIWCRSKTDWLSTTLFPGRTITLDYKTTGLSRKAWMKGIGYENRDIQACLYPRGLSILGYPKPEFIWLVQQVAAPYSCWLVGMSEPRKEIGNWKVERAVALWGKCSKANEWPDYDPRIAYSMPEISESKEFTEALENEEENHGVSI